MHHCMAFFISANQVIRIGDPPQECIYKILTIAYCTISLPTIPPAKCPGNVHI
jgi:hypothetical protein